MKNINRTERGFIQNFDAGFIKRIEVQYLGNSRITYADGSSSEIEIACSSYQAQYGLAASTDGRKLYMASWESGLFAYDISSCKIEWQCKKTKITVIIALPEYLLALRYGESIIMIGKECGNVQEEIKSTTIKKMFRLENGDILVDSIGGRICLIDESLTIKRRFNAKIFNPLSCLSQVIMDAYIKDGAIHISGFEEYPGKNYAAKGQIPFDRSIGDA